jgi:hypothetical protein
VLQVQNLTDEDIEKKLIRPEWPQALKFLLQNTLRVKVNQRWTAKKAFEYLTFVFSSMSK